VNKGLPVQGLQHECGLAQIAARKEIGSSGHRLIGPSGRRDCIRALHLPMVDVVRMTAMTAMSAILNLLISCYLE
jgi:hypothetical protein